MSVVENDQEAVASSKTDESKIRRIEAEIDDLKSKWPPHSVPVWMWQKLEELEDDLEKARGGG
jgi:hypothetical protein